MEKKNKTFNSTTSLTLSSPSPHSDVGSGLAVDTLHMFDELWPMRLTILYNYYIYFLQYITIIVVVMKCIHFYTTAYLVVGSHKQVCMDHLVL